MFPEKKFNFESLFDMHIFMRMTVICDDVAKLKDKYSSETCVHENMIIRKNTRFFRINLKRTRDPVRFGSIRNRVN